MLEGVVPPFPTYVSDYGFNSRDGVSPFEKPNSSVQLNSRRSCLDLNPESAGSHKVLD